MDDVGPEGAASLTALSTQPRESAADRRRHAKKKTAIVVLGMHRSGTSALTRVLNLLGCDLPKTLMGGGRGNDAGHWESDAVVAFNDALLESSGSAWHDWLPINPAWHRSPKADEFRSAAIELLEREFGGSRLFALKDPRICRLAPFWLDVIEAADVRPALVLPIRNPLEVSASLESRDGFDPGLGRLIWLRHVLDAEASTRMRDRFFCGFEGLLYAWPRLASCLQERLGVALPRSLAAAEAEIEAFLAESLRHHRDRRENVVDNPILSAWIRDAFAIFDTWVETGERSEDYVALDRIRAEFDAAGPAFAKVVTVGRRAAESAARLQSEVAQLTAERDAAVTTAAQLSIERDRLNQDLEQQISREATAQEAAARQAEQLRGELEAARQAALEKERLSAALGAERDRALARAEIIAAECRQLEQRQDSLQNQLQEAMRERGYIQELREALAVRDQHLAERSVEIARLSELLLGAERSARAASDESSAALRRLAQLEAEHAQHLEGLRDSLDAANRAHAETRTKLAETERRLNERFAETARLMSFLREQESATEHAAAEAEWIRRVAATLLAGGERWRGQLFQLLPGFVIRLWVLRHLKRQRLFDGEAYLRANPDVARAGVNPLRHYIHHGIKEGRRRS